MPPGQLSQVYGALAKGFARSGDWRRAIEVINLLQCDNLEPNEQAGDAKGGVAGRCVRMLCMTLCMGPCSFEKLFVTARLRTTASPVTGVWQRD